MKTRDYMITYNLEKDSISNFKENILPQLNNCQYIIGGEEKAKKTAIYIAIFSSILKIPFLLIVYKRNLRYIILKQEKVVLKTVLIIALKLKVKLTLII